MDAAGYEILFDISIADAPIWWEAIFVGVFACAMLAYAAATSRNKIVRLVSPLGAAACLAFGLFEQTSLLEQRETVRRAYETGDYQVFENCSSRFQRDPADREGTLLVVGDHRFHLSRYNITAGFDGTGVDFFEHVCARIIVVQNVGDQIVWLGIKSGT